MHFQKTVTTGQTRVLFKHPELLRVLLILILFAEGFSNGFCAAGFLINDSDPLINYDAGWFPSGPRGMGDYCDDIHYCPTVGGAATYEFTGTGIDYIAPRGSAGAVAVYLDGILKTNVNPAGGEVKGQQVLFSAMDLAPGKHAIKIATQSAAPGVIDAFQIYGTPKPIKLACMGDSITYGSGTMGDNSWPSQLARMLGGAYTIQNYGLPGATMLKTGDSPYWNSWALSHSSNWTPDVVIIALGANDSKPQNWIHKDSFADDCQEMIRFFKLLPSHPKIYLSTCATVKGPGAFGITEAVVSGEVVPVQKQIARETGCEVIDVNAATKSLAASDYVDGVHPNDDGALRIAQTVYQALTGQKAPAPLTPGIPKNLSASAGNATVTLNWARVRGLAKYNIERSENDADYVVIATNQLEVKFTDRGLANGRSYFYKVSAENISGKSPYGEAVSTIPRAQTNLALNRPVTASSTTDNCPATNAVDGNTGTRWSSEHADPQWICVDLGRSRPVTRVKLNWETAYAEAYEIQTSADGSAWTTIYGTTNGTGGVNDLTKLSGNGRYVRMYGTVRGSRYGYSLWEFEIYGD
jgi:lysophospholipase L1-like esterase